MQDSWILACGPINKKLYEEIVARGNSAFSRINQKGLNNNLMIKCTFDLSNTGDEINGDLYMSAKTNKLHISIPLDNVMLSQDSKVGDDASSMGI